MRLPALTCIALLLLPAPARAGEILAFAAQSQSDELAEEAILLLHCLAQRTNLPWEFTGSATGPHWLSVRQQGKMLAATYHSGTREEAFPLNRGGAQAACDRLEPETPVARLTGEPGMPGPGETAEAAAPSRQRTWLWVGAGVAVAALGGFLLWKNSRRPVAQQPDYQRVKME